MGKIITVENQCCPKCGGVMVSVGKYEWMCENCGYEVEGEEYDILYGDEVQTPVACRICGNFEHYPECFESCGVMNND